MGLDFISVSCILISKMKTREQNDQGTQMKNLHTHIRNNDNGTIHHRSNKGSLMKTIHLSYRDYLRVIETITEKFGDVDKYGYVFSTHCILDGVTYIRPTGVTS